MTGKSAVHIRIGREDTLPFKPLAPIGKLPPLCAKPAGARCPASGTLTS